MKKANLSPNRVRIIAGFWRSRLVDIALVPGLRPSTDRVRETVFNWLNPYLPGASVLDLFAGTGILGLEACSRGAKAVQLIEKNALAHQVLKENIDRLKPLPPNSEASCICMNALQWLKNQQEISAQVIFLDPPFDEPELLYESLSLILEKTKNHNPPIIYVESDAKLDNDVILAKMPYWSIRKQLVAGVVKASLLVFEDDTSNQE